MIAPAAIAAAPSRQGPPAALTADPPLPGEDGLAVLPDPGGALVGARFPDPEPVLGAPAGLPGGGIAGAVKSPDAVAAVAAPVISPGPWCVVAVK